eukprot:Skav208591  [mRNA]  locus=scaffold3152:347469:347888:- [translate_table: standard]
MTCQQWQRQRLLDGAQLIVVSTTGLWGGVANCHPWCSMRTLGKSQAKVFRLKRALRFMKRWLDAEEVVYIHCESGVHRAPSVVAVAVMCEMEISYEQALCGKTLHVWILWGYGCAPSGIAAPFPIDTTMLPGIHPCRDS